MSKYGKGWGGGEGWGEKAENRIWTTMKNVLKSTYQNKAKCLYICYEP